MSFLNRALAGVGVGAAKVDAKLNNDNRRQGDSLTGIVEVVGGKVEQSIDGIYITVHSTYEKEVDEKKVELAMEIGRFQLPETFVIQPDERKEIPFSFPLPSTTPVTRGKTKVWIQTGLDIKMALDPKDRDYLEVGPHPLLEELLRSIQQLGFRSTSVEATKGRNSLIVQEFEFKPSSSGPYRGRLDEIEFLYRFLDHQRLEIDLEVDRKARNLGSLLSELAGTDETHLRFSITQADVANLPARLAQILDQNA